MSNVVADQRFILTLIDKVTLLFPAQLVVETLMIERSQILSLPFYNPAILGCIHTGGKVIPLLSPAPFLGLPTRLMGEVLTVIHLGESADYLAGVGVIVERMTGSRMGLPSLQSQGVDTSTENTIKLFDLELIGRDVFQPQRWQFTESSA